MKNKITLTNDFHNSSVTLIVNVDNFGREILSSGQVKKARRTLCGISDCTCGDVAGCRPQKVQEMQDGRGMIDCN